MIWLSSLDETAPALPAVWLIATGTNPVGLAARSQLRRETARLAIARQLSLLPDAVEIGHDERGRPILARPAGSALQLSLATRAGLVAVALGRGPIGVDVERVEPMATLPLAALHPDERAWLRQQPEAGRALAFARIWSAKEAYVKARGTGFLRPPESFAVTLLPGERFSVSDADDPTQAQGRHRVHENGGQGILAAAVIMLG